jgi:cytochrome-b5 reductase
MIAGGSGITPMFQIIKSSVKDQNDKTKLALVYANVDESDIRQFPLLLYTRVYKC